MYLVKLFFEKVSKAKLQEKLWVHCSDLHNRASTHSTRSKYKARKGNKQRNETKKNQAAKTRLRRQGYKGPTDFDRCIFRKLCLVKVLKAKLQEKLWVHCSDLHNRASTQSARSTPGKRRASERSAERTHFTAGVRWILPGAGLAVLLDQSVFNCNSVNHSGSS